MNSTKKSLLVGQFTLLTMLPVSVDKVVISGDEEDQFRPKIQLYICWRFFIYFLQFVYKFGQFSEKN